jgi:phosphatidylinositol N-acetylglucosaminyltransferase subunit P
MVSGRVVKRLSGLAEIASFAVCFIIWSYVPEHMLHQLGITYYPDKYVPNLATGRVPRRTKTRVCFRRYWALAIPSYLCVAFFFTGIIYCSLNLLSTAPLDSFDTIVGESVLLSG